jgi:hypothetical protein
MCIVSNSIKFCTCKARNANQLQHYWQLYRRNKDKNEIIVGEVLLPYETVDLNYKSNQKTLLSRVNEPNAFDIPLMLQDNDILEIVFNNNDFYKRMVYGFKYTKDQWKIYKIDTFDLMGNFDEIMFGKILNHTAKVKKE